MEPISMMLGYAAIQTAMQLVIRPIADKFNAKGNQKRLIEQLEHKHSLDLDLMRLNKELEISNHYNLQEVSHALRLKEAEKQFNQSKEMWATTKFEAQVWPLLTPPHEQYFKRDANSTVVPVSIYLSRADIKSQYSLLYQDIIKNEISNYIEEKHKRNDCELLISNVGDWKNGFCDDAHILKLWNFISWKPTVILRPVQTHNDSELKLRLTLWGLGNNESKTTETVLSIKYKELLAQYIKEETNKINLPREICSKEHNNNLDVLESEIIDDRILAEKLKVSEEIRTKVTERFVKGFSSYVNCCVGVRSDIHHLIEYGFMPQMPTAMKLYNPDFKIPSAVLKQYRTALTWLTATNYQRDKILYTYTRTARALAQIDDPAFMTEVDEILREVIGIWANRKKIDNEIRFPENEDECVRLLNDNYTKDDDFLREVKHLFHDIERQDISKELDGIQLKRVTKGEEKVIVSEKMQDKESYKSSGL